MALYFVIAVLVVSIVMLRSWSARLVRTAKLEAELNAKGYYLRDDYEIRQGVECFKGHEQAYSLHTKNPFERHAVYAMSRDEAVAMAHDEFCVRRNPDNALSWEEATRIYGPDNK